jgi:YegS/Rv2252/BmrU family lipid kinase
VRACVIFNPTARGDKARKFRRHLDIIGGECALKQTTRPGDARGLASEAVKEGFETVVAAGGDGTLNEVLNGIGDAPDGFARARLGVLPLGTVNVFAKEIGLPTELKRAWETLRAGREMTIDLPHAEFESNGKREKRYFAQMAGAGLDARAIELVDWELKKKLGPLAYVWAGFNALKSPLPQITAKSDSHSASGVLVLVGNGRFYGGRYRVFSQTDLQDGQLQVVVFPQTNLATLAQCIGMFLAGKDLPSSVADSFKAREFTLTSPSSTPMEVDGENTGHLPARFSIESRKLRVVVP